MASSVTISGSSTTAAETRSLSTLSILGSASIDTSEVLTLLSGDTTVAVPPNAVGVVVIPSGLTGTVLYRTNQNAGDAGLPISLVNGAVHTFPALTPISIILNSSVTQTGTIEVWFW